MAITVKEGAMVVTRREALATAVAGRLAMTGAAQAEEKPLTLDQRARLTDAERQWLEAGGPVVTKTFIATLRKRFSDETAAELRTFIDPRYLKEHGLQEGVFPIQRVVTGDIYSNNLADDPCTALTVAATEGGAKECFLFRLTVHQGTVYIAPLAPPDKQTKSLSRRSSA
jgi:hypothetical protein